MNWKVQLFKLNYDAREAEAVASVLESEWLTMGERTVAFERAFADYLGHQTEAVAVSNGTAALHLALLALDIGPGDEVIIPSLTFVADINVVIIAGATPVLADCRSLTDWNIDPDDIERKITDKTKAVMVVHYAGIPCDMRRIVELCRKHDLWLIEDCAHAPGAKFAGQSVGTFGDLGCFSFFSNKNLSVGEGGMVTSTDPSLIQDVRFLRSHGMTALTLERHQGRAISYDVNRPGLNYRIDEIRAALGLVQLSKLDAANRQRDAIVQRYMRTLSGINEFLTPFATLASQVEPACHIFPVLLPEGIDRVRVIESMKSAGIQTSIHYPPFQEFLAYQHLAAQKTPVAAEISRRELTLPLYPGMTEDDVALVTDALIKAESVVH